ncbi:hypothetical protein BD769DRAFT_1395855 [Suillus cothurnatus]|nr:hypothetical protein BD769DRAFT_1395855 [Suillus cothurnatus]
MPHMPRLCPTNTTKPKAHRPIAVMSVSKKPLVEAHAPENDEASMSLGASSLAEDPLAGVEQIPTHQKRGPTSVNYCSKPGQFWPDGQEPPFKGQKAQKHYSNYSGTNEEDMFDMDEDDATPPSTVGPTPPLPITVHVLVGKWVDGGNKALDLEDLDLLSEIMDIPQEVSSILLPLSDAVNVRQILDFKLPNIDDGSFEQTGASCFDRVHPNENLVLQPYIPPKSWVYSL